MISLTLEGTQRKDNGTKFARQLRRDGFIPCNLYGGSENILFQAPYSAFKNLIYNPNFFTVKVTIEGKEYNTIIKDVQFHPVTDKILHVDFLELVPEKKIVTEIPVHLTGLPIGVKIGGGKLRQKVRKLKVKSLAKHLIEHIEVNVEDLQLGKSIKVEELNIENMEVLTSPYIPVATVAVPRAVVATEAEGDAGAEPGAETAEPGGETKEGGEASADGGGDAA